MTTSLPGVDDHVERLEVAAGKSPFAQPRPLFDQPRTPTRRSAKAIVPMGPKALEIKARFRELFHAYTNRMDRSQQSTMGPSEAGSPCDRRLAMSLMRIAPVNPGGDNWASWVGTQIHRGIEELFLWADAGSGRYAPELKVQFPSMFLPGGTSDLLDRTLCIIVDWKAMGSWSLNKLGTEGPNVTYQKQAHLYGYGARLKGEVVRDVAIVGLPREASSLEDMYVWTEPYDPGVARDALARVDRIGKTLEPGATDYQSYAIDPSDCRFCPFHLKGAKTSEGGVCNGRS